MKREDNISSGVVGFSVGRGRELNGEDRKGRGIRKSCTIDRDRTGDLERVKLTI